MSHRASSAISVRLVRLARQLAARVVGSDKHQTGISAIRSLSAGLFYKRAERVQLMSQQTPIDSIGLKRDSSSSLYERVGGKSAVASVVNLLYYNIINVPCLLRLFYSIQRLRLK